MASASSQVPVKVGSVSAVTNVFTVGVPKTSNVVVAIALFVSPSFTVKVMVRSVPSTVARLLEKLIACNAVW